MSTETNPSNRSPAEIVRRWEWDMGCPTCGLCVCLQADAGSNPIAVCEVDQHILAVRAIRKTLEALR